MTGQYTQLSESYNSFWLRGLFRVKAMIWKEKRIPNAKTALRKIVEKSLSKRNTIPSRNLIFARMEKMLPRIQIHNNQKCEAGGKKMCATTIVRT